MTKEEYLETKERVVKGLEAIQKAGGFSKAPKHWVVTFNKLANDLLDYEVENDLLPI